MKGRFPIAVLYLQIDPTLVDVNVHPAKTEVRLQYSTDIQNLVAMTIREKLREGSWSLPAPISETDSFFGVRNTELSPRAGAVSGLGMMVPNRSLSSSPRVSESSTHRMDMQSLLVGDDHILESKDSKQSLVFGSLTSGQVSKVGDSQPVHISQNDWNSTDLYEDLQVSQPSALGVPGLATYGVRSQTGEVQQRQTLPSFEEMRMIGSFGRCFLFFEYDDRLLCLDQHAFHERILYEKLAKDRGSLTNSQQLLISEVVELRPTQVALLLDRKADLEELGFRLNEVSPDSIEVLAVPAFLAKAPIEELFSQITRKEFVYTNQRPEEQDTMHHILSTMACHGAVRSGDDLTEDEVRTLFAQSKTVDFWHNCPHGRPVLKWFERRDVENWFSR